MSQEKTQTHNLANGLPCSNQLTRLPSHLTTQCLSSSMAELPRIKLKGGNHTLIIHLL